MPVIKKKEGLPEPRGNKNEARYDKVLMGPGEYEVTRSSSFKIIVYLKPRSEEDTWWIITTKEN